MGYNPEEWVYDIDGKTYRNIVVGTNKSFTGEHIIIGAHYDSCFNPGADDNASGIAGLLELARMLKKPDLKVPVMFVAFTNEEPPFFMTGQMGSAVFVRALKESSVKVKAAVILEMIGYYPDGLFSQKYLPLLGPFYPNKADFVAIVGNFASRGVVDFLDNDFKRHQYFPVCALIAPSFVPGINFSDHWSFWQEGYPAVMITDTAYLRNKNYHTATDTVTTLDYEKMAKVVLGLKESIVRLSKE
ncbi:MAG: M28 family peptidase [Candidatus Omnitrophica bacterium]|nr:M28 family peptidase [Candidatus Omnitrophota bacterium]